MARHFGGALTVLLAMVLVAGNFRLIWQASEVKQYSSDASISLALILVALYFLQVQLTPLRTTVLAAIGGVALWFSHPAVFVLSAVGVTLLIAALIRKDWRRLGALLVVFTMWMASFALCYVVSLDHTAHDPRLQEYHASLFLPWPSSASEWHHFRDLLWNMIGDLWVFSNRRNALLLMLVGCIAVALRGREKLFLFLLPLPLAMVASMLHLYPIDVRFFVFMIPAGILLVAAGMDLLYEKLQPYAPRIVFVVFCFLASYVAFEPVGVGNSILRQPIRTEEIRPVMAYLRSQRRPQDIIYVMNLDAYAFRYYAPAYGFREGDWVTGVFDGTDALVRWKAEMDTYKGQERVWVVFVKRLPDRGPLQRSYLDSIGSQRASYTAPGAGLFLYDLTAPSTS